MATRRCREATSTANTLVALLSLTTVTSVGAFISARIRSRLLSFLLDTWIRVSVRVLRRVFAADGPVQRNFHHPPRVLAITEENSQSTHQETTGRDEIIIATEEAHSEIRTFAAGNAEDDNQGRVKTQYTPSAPRYTPQVIMGCL